MKAKIQQITKNKFVRNVAIVATGTAGAQAITMAFAPFLTRIYGPETFGLLGVFVALIAILAPITALTYPVAIVLPKKDTDAKLIAKLSFFLAFIITCFFSIILYFWGESILNLIGSEKISPYMMLIPLALFFATLLQITEQWLIRKKQFKTTAKIAIVQSLIINSTKTGIGWINPTAVVLITITALGSALHAFMMAISLKFNTNAKAEMDSDDNPKTVNQLAIAHIDFPLYRAPQLFINAISQNMPVLILASFFGPIAAGFYSLARMVLEIPAKLIGKSVGDVFYPRINDASHNNEELDKLILKATKALALLGLVPFGIVIVIGPWLFSFVFGEEWNSAGEYARWLSLWLYSAFINRPSFVSIPVLGFQKEIFLFEVLSLFLRFATLLVSYYLTNSALVTIASFSTLNVLLNLLLITTTIYLSKK
ncbi:lipopolysaccharide biosynthesis protein [Thiomicrorhabdus sp.]|uniref:lipopolysaccharide biosynthesis protein n=1 Tax=Thiomicrorhabdus sp. TaxID=2039724 RepID=UPI002AA90582|nr:oligosaccharide flippase family protein [Thiomicrorhabdus sp.]